MSDEILVTIHYATVELRCRVFGELWKFYDLPTQALHVYMGGWVDCCMPSLEHDSLSSFRNVLNPIHVFYIVGGIAWTSYSLYDFLCERPQVKYLHGKSTRADVVDHSGRMTVLSDDVWATDVSNGRCMILSSASNDWGEHTPRPHGFP